VEDGTLDPNDVRGFYEGGAVVLRSVDEPPVHGIELAEEFVGDVLVRLEVRPRCPHYWPVPSPFLEGDVALTNSDYLLLLDGLRSTLDLGEGMRPPLMSLQLLPRQDLAGLAVRTEDVLPGADEAEEVGTPEGLGLTLRTRLA
jgi:hypothetical protein